MTERTEPQLGARRNRGDWLKSISYRAGDRVRWKRYVKLRCGRSHYCGDAAVDPWDPGWGWDSATARSLWHPVGPISRLIVWWERRHGRIR